MTCEDCGQLPHSWNCPTEMVKEYTKVQLITLAGNIWYSSKATKLEIARAIKSAIKTEPKYVPRWDLL